MRVRYGKPIKVKSLLGKQNIFSTISSIGGGYSYVAKTDGSFLGGWGSQLRTNDNCKKINLISGHKYFLYMSVDMVNSTVNQYDSAYFITIPDGEIKSSGGANVLLSNKYSATLITPSSDTVAIPGIGNYYQKWTVGDLINFMIVLDLTDIFGAGNEPTLSNFYNKYNKYFPLIATGEEITIDDKAGQVAYENLNDNVIRCKVAGGSSDIYYGYNQLAEIPQTTGTKWYGYNCTLTAEDGLVTCVANGNNYPACASQFYKTIYELDHIYMHLAKFKQDTAVTGGTFGINTNGMSTKLSGNSTSVVGEWVDLYFFGRGQGSSTYNNTFNIQGGANAVNGATFYVKDCVCIDLTEWFGEGKEPSTVAEFKEQFTKNYYGFCQTPIKLTRYQIEALPSYGYNQLIQFIKRTNYNGITWTPTTNGIYDLSGTSTNTYSSWGEQLVDEHKYLLCLNILANPNNVQLKIGLLNVSYGSTGYITSGNVYKIVKYNTGDGKSFGIVYPSSGTNLAGMKIQVMCIDLTDWYGAGSEPSSEDTFKQTFPNLYYPYSKKRLLNKYMINKLIN